MKKTLMIAAVLFLSMQTTISASENQVILESESQRNYS